MQDKYLNWNTLPYIFYEFTLNERHNRNNFLEYIKAVHRHEEPSYSLVHEIAYYRDEDFQDMAFKMCGHFNKELISNSIPKLNGYYVDAEANLINYDKPIKAIQIISKDYQGKDDIVSFEYILSDEDVKRFTDLAANADGLSEKEKSIRVLIRLKFQIDDVFPQRYSNIACDKPFKLIQSIG